MLNHCRVENWVAQLKEEGFLEDGDNASSSTSATSSVTDASAVAASAPFSPEIDSQDDLISHLEENNAALRKKLEEYSHLLDSTIETHADNGYIPHYNPKTKSTMWTSTMDGGRTCYYTVAEGNGGTTATTGVSISP